MPVRRLVVLLSTIALGLLVGRVAADAGKPAPPDPREVRDLIGRLGDSDFETREKATWRLRELGEAVLPALREATQSPDPEVRSRAAHLILLVELPKELPRLIRDLGDDEFAVRQAAWFRLQKIGRPALPALREALGSPDFEVRFKAEKLIQTIAGP